MIYAIARTLPSVNIIINSLQNLKFSEYGFNQIKEFINLNPENIKEDWRYLENRILANIASALWGKNYYYNILLNEDKQFIESINNIPLAKNLIK